MVELGVPGDPEERPMGSLRGRFWTAFPWGTLSPSSIPVVECCSVASPLQTCVSTFQVWLLLTITSDQTILHSWAPGAHHNLPVYPLPTHLSPTPQPWSPASAPCTQALLSTWKVSPYCLFGDLLKDCSVAEFSMNPPQTYWIALSSEF